MNYTNQKRINTTESVKFPANLGDVTLDQISTTGNIMVGSGTNLIVKEQIFCRNLSSLGKVKATSIVCADSCVAKEYDAEYVSAFSINGEIIERKVAPNSSPIFISVEQLAEQQGRVR